MRFTGLGKNRLDESAPSDIERLYDRIRKTGNKRTQGALSGRSVLHVHRVLFAAMRRAVSWRLISSNPCVSEAPKAKRYEARTRTAAQGRLLIETARTTLLYPPIMLALGCGLRRGEVCALKWAGVDFERGTVHLLESIQARRSLSRRRQSGAGVPSGCRRRYLPRCGMRAHKAKQREARLAAGATYPHLGLVFADSVGEPVETVVDRHIIPWDREAGRHRASPISRLRHRLPILIERGVAVTTVSECWGMRTRPYRSPSKLIRSKGQTNGGLDDGRPPEGRRNRLVNPWPRLLAGSVPGPMWAKCGPIASEGTGARPQTLME